MTVCPRGRGWMWNILLTQMIDVSELKRWARTLTPGNDVAVDDGGLTLVELDDGVETGAYLEVGGIPLPGDNEDEEDDDA